MREGPLFQTIAKKSCHEVSPKSANLCDASRSRRGNESGNGSASAKVSDDSGHLFQSVGQFPSDETAPPGSAVEIPEEEEAQSVSFDKLFSSLSKIIPGIVWGLIMAAMGREGEKPSSESMKTMQDGWNTFFKACGVEYVGEGINVKLRSVWWLLLVPIVSTLAAIV